LEKLPSVQAHALEWAIANAFSAKSAMILSANLKGYG